jgi:haloalkane dehalogenase
VRTLAPAERAAYARPFASEAARLPVRVWPTQVPIDGHPADVHAVVAAYARWLETTPLPKLLLHGEPGMLIRADEVARIRARMPALTVVDVGPGLHYLQEDQPEAIGQAIAAWLVAQGLSVASLR